MASERVHDLPLTCEFMLGDRLSHHVDDFRGWLVSTAELAKEALIDSGTIGSCDDLFDERLWETAYSTGEYPQARVGRLGPRVWARLASSGDIHGLGMNLRPHPHIPHVPDPPFRSTIDLTTTWYADHPNWVSATLAARFCVEAMPRAWLARLTDNFKTFGVSTSTETAFIGWAAPQAFTRYPLGSIDYRSKVSAIGWAMLVGDDHLDQVGGYGRVDGNDLFFSTECLGDVGGRRLYYLQCAEDPRDAGFRAPHNDRWTSVCEFLSPLLPPPPLDPASLGRS